MGLVEGQEEARGALWDAGMDLTCEQRHVRCKRRKRSKRHPLLLPALEKLKIKPKTLPLKTTFPEEGFCQQFYFPP